MSDLGGGYNGNASLKRLGVEISYTFHNNRFCIAKMPRQVGKCLQLNTPIRLRNKRTGKIIEMTIGEFYEQQRNLSNVRTTNEGVD